VYRLSKHFLNQGMALTASGARRNTKNIATDQRIRSQPLWVGTRLPKANATGSRKTTQFEIVAGLNSR
jgi:hypothetical protein